MIGVNQNSALCRNEALNVLEIQRDIAGPPVLGWVAEKYHVGTGPRFSQEMKPLDVVVRNAVRNSGPLTRRF